VYEAGEVEIVVGPNADRARALVSTVTLSA